MTKSDWRRFWDKVQVVKNGCWKWTAGSRYRGYGAFKLNGHTVSSHRIVWNSVNGKIPDGKEVCHKCDNPPCVNPEHLFLGSHSDNMKDAYDKGRLPERDMDKIRSKSISKIRKLTKDQLFNILDRFYSGDTIYEISEDMPVSPTSISHIKNKDRPSYNDWVEEWERKNQLSMRA